MQVKSFLCSVCFFLGLLGTSSCTKNIFDGTDSGSVYDISGLDYVLVQSEMDLSSEVSYDDPQEVIDAENEDYAENSSFSQVVSIVLSTSSPATVGSLPEGVSAEINGNDIVLTSTISGVEYILSGSTSDGMFKLYSSKKYKLVLNGVSIINADGPAINLQSSKRAFVVLGEGTANYLEDGSSYASAPNDEDQKGCFFAEGKLLFSSESNNPGTLTVKGNYKHAIVCDDYVLFRRGNKVIVSSASKDGIHANDGITILGGLLSISSKGDAIECEEGGITISGGATTLSTTGESSHGLKSYGPIGISGGALKVTTSGDASKGISGDSDISITGGKIITICTGGAIYDSEDNDSSSPSGIKCDSNLVMSGATFTAFASGKGGKGISVDGNATFENSTISIMTTGTKFIYSSSIDSSPKGVKVEGDLTVNSGSIKIQTMGGEGSEALESKSTLTINGGDIEIAAYDDCINAAKAISINGGNIYCYSSNNDGIDSNGTLSISGGLVLASGTQVPEEGIDCDQNNFTITGGTIIGFGGTTSTPTSSTSSQNSLIYSGSASAGVLLNISGSDGANILSCIVPRQYQQMTLLFSSPSLTTNGSYTISGSGSITDGILFHNLYTAGTYSDGTAAYTFTQSSRVTTVGSTQGGIGGFGGGGNPGGRW